MTPLSAALAIIPQGIPVQKFKVKSKVPNEGVSIDLVTKDPSLLPPGFQCSLVNLKGVGSIQDWTLVCQ